MMQTREAHDFWGLHKNKNCAFHNKLPLRHSQNFDFLDLKICHRVSFWGAPTHAGITEFENFLLQLKNQRSGSKTVWGFSIILILKGIMRF